MRRIVVFFVYFSFLLFCGGQYLNASIHPNKDFYSHHFGKKHHVKISTQEAGSSIIEEADLDLEEEFLNKDDVTNKTTREFFVVKYNSPEKWFPTFSPSFCLNDDYYKRLQFSLPYSGKTNPIYITQRVLRI
nr:hypothetical protein [uncultured Flavobacterium sp.]